MSKPSRITILSPELANQIAAGEVVERPASVIKELVENSLDAGATWVEVDIEKGGLSLLRVTDQGEGMTPEEALLSLKRHATSKIRNSEDLFNIKTLGFRGEALPSIASVSKLTLITRPVENLAGYLISTESGRMQGPGREVGAGVGTQIEVRDLFYNVPARLKFMKSEATEFGHIHETIIRLALSFPHVHFKLKRAGKIFLDLPPHPTLQERAQATLQMAGQKESGAVLYRTLLRQEGISIEAVLSNPQDSVSTARNVYIFVNRRFIRDRALLNAIKSGYGDTLLPGRFPLAVIHLQVPESKVDVNVHPQKLEARFLQPQLIYSAIHEMVQRLVIQSPWILSEPLDPLKDFGSSANPPFLAAESRPLYGAKFLEPAQKNSFRQPTHLIEQAKQPSLDLILPKNNTSYQSALPSPTDLDSRILFGHMRYIGQLFKTYLLCEAQQDLVMIDQHAAHERLVYERLRTAKSNQPMPSQRLLFPMNLDFEPVRAALIEDHLSELEGLGFELRHFGNSSFALMSIPDLAEFGRGAKIYQDPKVMLDKVLDDFEVQGKTLTAHDLIQRILATIACHSVVRAGDVLDGSQAKALLHAIDEIEFAPYCPHGRPILSRFKQSELDRRFGRIA